MVFYRIAEFNGSAHLARTLVDLLPEDDAELNRDLARLVQIRQKRAELAASYFKENASQWREIRALHVPEADVEARMLELIGDDHIDTFLDIGTGTGRVLELVADQISHGIGIDSSPEMLAIARAQLEQDKYRHVQFRKGDMYNMPLADRSVDLASLHLVLHYSLDPAHVISEAARTLKQKGRLVIVDFAQHQEEHLRTEHKHQRLGFSDKEIRKSLIEAGLKPGKPETLAGDPLTVKIWHAHQPSLH